MYASHNSMTGNRPRRWWQWVFAPFSRCQNLPIGDQLDEGVRFYDLRVRIDKRGALVACHGLVEYDVTVMALVKLIEGAGCRYRVVLEDKVGGRRCRREHLEALRRLFLTAGHPLCCYVMSKREGLRYENPYSRWQPVQELTRHHWTQGKPFVPRRHVDMYLDDKARHALGDEPDKVYYYDFVEIK